MGKLLKKYFCPALGRVISKAECGDGRMSRIACPVGCEHNPFDPANYAMLLEAEHRLSDKSTGWLLEHATELTNLRETMQRGMREGTPDVANLTIGWHLFHLRDQAGLTCAEGWQRAGFVGLRNDERVALQGQMQSRVALLEVHRVLDAESIEAVDLLADPAVPLRIYDRGLAARANRFTVVLGPIYPLPFYWRIVGFANVLATMEPFEPLEVVEEIVRHLGGPAERAAMPQWLFEHMARFNEALTATGLFRRRDLMRNLAAEWGTAVYRPRQPLAALLTRLDASSEVQRELLNRDEITDDRLVEYTWFDPTPGVELHVTGSRPLLGSVRFGRSLCRLSAIGIDRLARLRHAFDQLMGGDVEFVSETREDVVDRFLREEPGFNEALVSPRLRENPQRLAIATSMLTQPTTSSSTPPSSEEVLLEQDRRFPDEPVPALEDHTPRQAVADPRLRPRVIRLMKDRIRSLDERNRASGRQDDLNGLVRELGLNEILFDPPPPRPPLPTDTGAEP